MRSLAGLTLLSLLSAGCFSVHTPALIDEPQIGPVELAIGVLPPPISTDYPDINEYRADLIVEDLQRTRLFTNVYRITDATPEPDLFVEVTLPEENREGWCGESYVYTAFTLFVIPGCAWSRGYDLHFRRTDAQSLDVHLEYEALHLSGWVALFMHPFPNWSLPPEDDVVRANHLRAKLVPLVKQLRVGSEAGAAQQGVEPDVE